MSPSHTRVRASTETSTKLGSYSSFARAYNCGRGSIYDCGMKVWITKLSGTPIAGMENGNGSIFCTEMEPNMKNKRSERNFDIPYITRMA